MNYKDTYTSTLQLHRVVLPLDIVLVNYKDTQSPTHAHTTTKEGGFTTGHCPSELQGHTHAHTTTTEGGFTTGHCPSEIQGHTHTPTLQLKRVVLPLDIVQVNYKDTHTLQLKRVVLPLDIVQVKYKDTHTLQLKRVVLPLDIVQVKYKDTHTHTTTKEGGFTTGHCPSELQGHTHTHPHYN